MNEQTVRALGLLLACNARVEAMRAANMQCQALGESMAYDSGDFNDEAVVMELIANGLHE